MVGARLSDLVSIETIHGSIVDLRGRPAILDSDLAAYFDIETRVLNQAVKRNEDRFAGYAFQLTEAEFETLKSQTVTTDSGRGGRRSPPWFFTEHGVVMAATLLSSERAVKASRRIVEAFVTLKRGAASTALVPLSHKRGPLTALRSEFLPKLRSQFETLMNTEINPKQRKTLRAETEEFIANGLNSLKARLKKAGHESDEIEARALKYLAEAEEAQARAATQHQMTEKQRIKNQANQLRLMIRAELAMTSGEISDLLEVLDDLGKE